MAPAEAREKKEENGVRSGAVGSKFSRIERREWGLWVVAGIITLLLTLGLASFILPLLHHAEDQEETVALTLAVRGLVGLVLLFNVYIIYQQVHIHRMRRQLVKKEELFHLISENAADMIAVVDMEGKRIYNSLAYQRVLGYSPEELRGSSGFAEIHPEDQKRVREAAEEAQRSGQGKAMEYRIRHKDGTWRTLESTSRVIRDKKGEPEQLVIVNRDISERKRAEEALRLSEASFRSMVEYAPYGIYRAGMNGQLLEVNPALQSMLGYTERSELLQTNLETGIYRLAEEFRMVKELCAGAEELKDMEVEWKKKDGAAITVRCSGRYVKEGAGGRAYFDMFAEDVTEKRVLERQLRMAQKMEAVGRLSGGIAHDFNNLLGVIIGYSQVLKRELGPGSPLCEHAEEVEKAGQRAAALTRQLLAFSRQQVLTPAVLNLNALVSDMEKMLQRLLGEDVAVTTALDPGLKHTKVDQGQIEQVIMNLAVNARDAMPQGGRLKIETANVEFDELYVRQHAGSKRGLYVMLAVSDTGMGMTAEIQAHIFEPFFTTKEVGKGTGLGLATVYGVVKQSGGYIAVESAPGKGASFQVYLPRVEERVEAEVPGVTGVGPLRGAETILLVEDADPLRKLAQSFLESNGYRVLAAPDGEKAMQVALQNAAPIQLLLTDVVMPGMNGRVLAERMAARQPSLKVLYMSGYTDSFIAGHGVLEPGTHLMHKPFTEEALVRKVREVLDSEKKRPEASARERLLVGSGQLHGR
ncbi:MAG: PAS domain S-box protein [Acidobacteriia bacterium]|nr:PAS domain S-box protein [Terriglobia bacterium]